MPKAHKAALYKWDFFTGQNSAGDVELTYFPQATLCVSICCLYTFKDETIVSAVYQSVVDTVSVIVSGCDADCVDF